MGLRNMLLSWAEPELAAATKLLREVKEQLDRAWRENIRLKDEREEQARVITALKEGNAALRTEVARLTEANRQQRDQIAAFDRRLDDMEHKYGNLMRLYYQLQAANGKDINIGPNPPA